MLSGQDAASFSKTKVGVYVQNSHLSLKYRERVKKFFKNKKGMYHVIIIFLSKCGPCRPCCTHCDWSCADRVGICGADDPVWMGWGNPPCIGPFGMVRSLFHLENQHL